MPRPTIPAAKAGPAASTSRPTSTSIATMAVITSGPTTGLNILGRIRVPHIVTSPRGPITGGIMPGRCEWASPRTM